MERIKKKNIFSKYKELLNNLFKESFGNKLNNLEKRTENHLSLISSTIELTKNITDLAIQIQNQIQLKNKEDKKNSLPKKKQINKNIQSPKSNQYKKIQYKTPLRQDPKTNKLNDIKTSETSRKIDSKIKRNITCTIDVSNLNREKSKSYIRTKKFKKINTSKMNKTFTTLNNNKAEKNSLNRPSVTSSYKSREKEKNNDNFLTINNNRNDNKVYKYRNKNSAIVRKISKNMTLKTEYSTNFLAKTILNNSIDRRKSKNSKNESSINIKNKFKTLNENNESISIKKITYKNRRIYEKRDKNKNSINYQKNEKEKVTKNDKIIDGNINKINSMESNLQKSDELLNDDPLLIAPITDSDFQQKGELIISDTPSNEIKCIIEYFKLQDEKGIKKIFEFLDFSTLIQLKGTSKYFNKIIINYLLKYLNEKRRNIEKVKNEITSIQEPKSLTDFKLSQETESTIQLLNESFINKFFEEANTPKDDILFIFEVFFQLINNPIKDSKNNKEVFWEKCRLYFLNEGKGKIGDLFKNIIKNNEIDISEDNLYNIYNLVNNKLNIIIPSYFNKICSNMSLITFFIKDILNFLGFSLDKDDINLNGYWTYTKIINSIDKKINNIKKMNEQ